MKLEVGEFYLSASGNITKIVDYKDNEDKEDEYNYLANDDEWYRYDGIYGAEISNRDLIAHIPKELHLKIIELVNSYHTNRVYKKAVNESFRIRINATNK